MAELQRLSVADDDGWDDFAALSTCRCREAIPDDRASLPEEWRDSARYAPADRRVFHLLAVEDGQAVGAARLDWNGIRPNSAWLMFLYVLPGYRRRGIGSQLLAAVRAEAHGGGRSVLRTHTYLGNAPGEAFAERAGGRRGLTTEQNRCPTAGLDPVQLEAWRDRAAQRASGYSLVAFDGVCPDEHLDAFVAVVPVMNTAPRSGATEDWVPTREQLVEGMSSAVREGYDIWTVCARDDRTGQFVGYTELFLRHNTPWVAAQGDTGVHPDHRERGLGRWLKAHNALRLLAERPQVEYIATWNAAGNDAMLSINRAMGFEVVARHQDWDVPVCQR